jgi:hypothetical protein
VAEEVAEPLGQVVRISKKGKRSYAQVTLPTGLVHVNGKLYASAWSVAGFLVTPPGRTGEVVKVPSGAFERNPS